MLLRLTVIVIVLLSGCAAKDNQPQAIDKKDTLTVQDVIDEKKGEPETKLKTYHNSVFKDVTIEQVDHNQLVVQGIGKIAEPSFNWIIEDASHHIIKKGVATTDEGAPEWGNFSFTIDVKNKIDLAGMNLILFEGKVDGDHRENELLIPL